MTGDDWLVQVPEGHKTGKSINKVCLWLMKTKVAAHTCEG